MHRVFGGVVPEIASRAHLTSIVPVVSRALSDADSRLEDMDAIAAAGLKLGVDPMGGASLPFWPGGLSLLAAAPGLGKTSWLLRIWVCV